MLVDAIELERELLAGLREMSTVVDTSELRPAQLRAWMRDLVTTEGNALTLVFESFAFRGGVPLDADYVFDVRVLPNPHYIRELRPLTGRDAPVAEYLRSQPEAGEMLGQIAAFLQRWLPAFVQDQRSYLTVAIGCTGGQHRSVYFVETLAAHFAALGGDADPPPRARHAAWTLKTAGMPAPAPQSCSARSGSFHCATCCSRTGCCSCGCSRHAIST